MFVITDNFGFFNKELDHLISCTHRREYLSDFKTALVLTYTLACHYCPVHSQNRNLIREQNWHYYIVVGPKIFLDGGWSQKGCVRTSWQARGYVRSGLGAEGVVMAGCRDWLLWPQWAWWATGAVQPNLCWTASPAPHQHNISHVWLGLFRILCQMQIHTTHPVSPSFAHTHDVDSMNGGVESLIVTMEGTRDSGLYERRRS